MDTTHNPRAARPLPDADPGVRIPGVRAALRRGPQAAGANPVEAWGWRLRERYGAVAGVAALVARDSRNVRAA